MRLAILLFVVLSVIAASHAYWASGGVWPASNPKALSDTVVGDSRATAMPSAGLTYVVAGLIFTAGLVALARTAELPGLIRWIPHLGCWVLTVVFGLRGAFTYAATVGVAQWPYELTEPFRTLDRLAYAPLCLTISAGFFILALRGGPVTPD
ncbi:MAG: DUF3995 domain-containing protein [Pseudomonadota bacterium]